jgi:hypothetical protein
MRLSWIRRSAFRSAASLLLAGSVHAANLPPRNPFLADSSHAIAHGDSGQQDAVAQAGPAGPGRALGEDEIRWISVGPGPAGSATTGRYADGRRVIWTNGVDRISKIDHDSFRVVATYFLPGKLRYTDAEAEASIAAFDEKHSGSSAIRRGLREMQKLRDLSGVYTLVDVDHVYYIGDHDGTVTAWGDETKGDPDSPIRQLRQFKLPKEASGLLVGMNMTFDGWLVLATEHGDVLTVKRDFSDHRITRMKHSEGAAGKATGPGRGWVRNSMAVDEAGGIYVASQAHQHKLVWTRDRISTDEADGAWTAAYPNGLGHGTGATPSLMGFGAEDRFVVLTDGDTVMNMMLFWREAIPEDWKTLPGAPDRRIAGMLPANMGDPELKAIQSEQSVVVAGYGAFVVNNSPRNAPWYLPKIARGVLVSWLGAHPEYQPYGVQKFEWNPEARRLEMAWVNREVSSPSCVPIASYASDLVYLIGARDDRWTLEALDWKTGKSAFHYVIGGERFNPLFSGTHLDEAGRIQYATSWGRVRLDPEPAR